MPMTKAERAEFQRKAKTYLDRAGIVLTPEEADHIEIADLGWASLRKPAWRL